MQDRITAIEAAIAELHKRLGLLAADEVPLGRARYRRDSATIIDVHGARHALTAGERRVCETLVRHRGQMVSRADIEIALYGREVAARSLDNHVRAIRRKAGDTGAIISVHAQGYMAR